MENLTIQHSTQQSTEEEAVSSILCCQGFHNVFKLPACSLKSFRQKFRHRSSRIVPMTVGTKESSSAISEGSQEVSNVPSSSNRQRRHCWEEEANCSSSAAGTHGNKGLSAKVREVSKRVSAAMERLSKRSKHRDVISVPYPAASETSQAEKDCRGSSKACSLLLRAMTSSHVLYNDVISTLKLWNIVSKKPFSKPKECKLSQAEFVEKVTKPIRTRMKEIIKDLRREVDIVDQMLKKADEALDGQSVIPKFTETSDYFKEFREIASQCFISKVLADFARVVSAIQMLINKCSSLSDHLSALGPKIPFSVNHPFVRASIDGMTIQESGLELRLKKLVKEIAEYRKAMIYVSDEIKNLEGKLEKQAKKDHKSSLRKMLGRKKCPRSNRVVAQLHMARVPMMDVVNVMPSIEEEE